MRDVLAAFVDRHLELSRFCEMLESDEKPIMIVWGDDGIGKSSLLARLIHECASRKLHKSEVFVSKSRFNSYLEILRKIRDDLGPELFPNFTQLVNCIFPSPLQPRTPTININISGGAQSVLDRARLENVTVHGDIAAIIVKDNMINVPDPNLNISLQDRMNLLTAEFLKDLAPIVQNDMLIVLFDDIQELTDETYTWLWEGIISALEEGRLKNIRFILCGRVKPQLQSAAALSVKEAPLQPLGLSDIELYLERSGHVADGRAFVAQMLLAASNGIPLQVALQLDSYFQRFPDKRVRVNG
jgi:GTPase SAR1 family protein